MPDTTKTREYVVLQRDPAAESIWHFASVETSHSPDDARAQAQRRLPTEQQPGVWVAIPATSFKAVEFYRELQPKEGERRYEMPAALQPPRRDSNGDLPIAGQTDLGEGGPVPSIDGPVGEGGAGFVIPRAETRTTDTTSVSAQLQEAERERKGREQAEREARRVREESEAELARRDAEQAEAEAKANPPAAPTPVAATDEVPADEGFGPVGEF